MHTRLAFLAVLFVALLTGACGKPGADSLKDSFAAQLGANRFVKGFEREGDTLLFTGPGGDTGEVRWRVHIDSTSIEPNDDPANPYKGVVKSSWFANERIVKSRGRESNLPIELISNGLGQECWAFWRADSKSWSWE